MINDRFKIAALAFIFVFLVGTPVAFCQSPADNQDQTTASEKVPPGDQKDADTLSPSENRPGLLVPELKPEEDGEQKELEGPETEPASRPAGSSRKPATNKSEANGDETAKKEKRKTRSARKRIEKSLQKWLETSGIRIGLILILMIVLIKLTNVFSKHLLTLITRNRDGTTELKKRATTMSAVVRYILIAGVLAIAGMMILKEIQFDIAPILAGAGVVGLAFGFGAQSLVKDLISGFFILMEDQIRVGDVIQIADKRGTVEKVTLRMVVLRDVRGNVHYIPSGEISIVTNMTKEFSRYLFDIGIAYREDVDEVIEIIREIDREMREDETYSELILADLEVLGLQRFENSSVIIRARTKTKPGRQWKVGREFNKRLKKRFDELGIEIPFPHMTVYQGVDKKGEAPPLRTMTVSEDQSE